MTDRHPIENWGERLNIKGEELTIEQAMLLSLGHLNARMEKMLDHLEDMRVRLTRLELCVRTLVPDYDERTQPAVHVLQEAS
jgi:hypothetical protein